MCVCVCVCVCVSAGLAQLLAPCSVFAPSFHVTLVSWSHTVGLLPPASPTQLQRDGAGEEAAEGSHLPTCSYLCRQPGHSPSPEARLHQPSSLPGRLWVGWKQKRVGLRQMDHTQGSPPFFKILATSHSIWDLNSPTRDATRDPCSGSVES